MFNAKCPVCQESEDTYILDEGTKFVKRLVERNNRYACRQCKITWRRKNPANYQHLERQRVAV